MKIAGISIILLLGFANLALLCFQLLSGLRWIKVSFGAHRKTGMLLFVVALIHGVLGFIAQM